MQHTHKAHEARQTAISPSTRRARIRDGARGPASATSGAPQSAQTAQATSAAAASSGRPPAPIEIAGTRITGARHMIDPASGVRKIDLVRYVERAAARLLPQLAARPVMLVRAPQGLDGEPVFQRHIGRVPLPGVTLHEGLDPGHPPILSIDSFEALITVMQFDTIELHTWNARADDIERPERVVFDLDPDPTLPWERVVEAAQMTRECLDALGLRSFVKTSGGKGLHVVVPLVPAAGWDDVTAFARALAHHLAASWPAQFSATLGPVHRKRKIFVDWQRNARGAGTAVAWGARARPGLGVSVPLAWDQLEATTGAAQWTIANAAERLDLDDPWADYARVEQTVSAAMTNTLEEGGA